MTAPHNFQQSLKWSHEQEDQPWWHEVYSQAFPTMTRYQSVRQDGWAQRGGIDRLILLRDGTVLKIDEKARRKHRPDILLEMWSDNHTPGWANPKKELTCDYIAYALVPSQTCYLLPYQILRRAIKDNDEKWLELSLAEKQGFRTVYADNAENGRTWRTSSIVVPTQILLDAIRDCLVIKWSTPDDEDIF